MCGFPVLLDSDNRPAFISRVTQKLVKVMETNWKCHCANCCQSSGQVERMNWTLKETSTKLTLETGGAGFLSFPLIFTEFAIPPIPWA